MGGRHSEIYLLWFVDITCYQQTWSSRVVIDAMCLIQALEEEKTNNLFSRQSEMYTISPNIF